MEFFFEIGVEEIPAGFLPTAFADIKRLLSKALDDNRLTFKSIKSTGTPRRLMAVVKELAERQPDIVEERRGPALSAAYEESGNPTKATVGFAKSAGISVEQLEKVETPKGAYLLAKIKKTGKPALEVLKEILPKVIMSLPWRKSMRWGDGDFRFARPIHWILALLDGKVVDFEIEGIGSENVTSGHRFAAPGNFGVKSFEDYTKKLRHAYVMVDHEERYKTIVGRIRDRAKELGGEPACFEELYEELNFLVEWPVIVDASFPAHYLEVPDIVLIASMIAHQRYVPLRGPNGALLNKFITVANTPVTDRNIVARGNARVLNARLADAEFFYKTDLKKSLEAYAGELTSMLYIKGMGSYADKSKRIEAIAEKISEWIAPGKKKVAQRAKRAAALAKADLVSHMVGEFPSLQGQMGGIYARESGEPEEVARAIEEHYLPKSAADIEAGNIPKSIEGAVVAIADRADSLAACFALDLLPKGDQDPYALRRAVLGILAIVKDRKLKLPISELLDSAVSGVLENSKKDKNTLISELSEFIRERIRFQLIADGAAPDTAEAVLRSGADDYLEVSAKAKALTTFRGRDDFEDLATSFRRVGNILEKFHKDSVDETLFAEDAERELWKLFCEKRDKVEGLAKSGKYLEALEAMAEIRPAVDAFFEKALVNDPKDAARRVNRHSLLFAIHKAFLAVADFSAIARSA